MRTIAIANPKGGCGKTTIATCLASHLAYDGYQVGLQDLDPQRSARDWLHLRGGDYPPVHDIAPDAAPKAAGGGLDVLLLDTPAALHGEGLRHILRRADVLLVPVVPSPIDMRAAWRFLEHLLQLKAIASNQTRVGLVANRIQTRTLVYRELSGFLEGFRFPIVAQLRETQNYIRAAERGLGIADLPAWQAWQDWDEWDPLIHWLASRASRPRPH